VAQLKNMKVSKPFELYLLYSRWSI